MLRSLLFLLAPSMAMGNLILPGINAFAADPSPCTTADAIVSSCYNAIPTFSDAPLTQIAACLCCSAGTWSPNYFDGPVSSCAQALQSEHPESTSLISVYSGLEGACSMVGSVPCSGAVTGTSTITSAPTTRGSATAGSVTGSAACGSAAGIVESCSLSMTNPTFDEATEDQLAACVCYDGTTWVPNVFDGYAKSCASWAKTGNPTLYKTYTSIATFCEYVGDVEAATVSTASTSKKTSATTTRTSSGGGGGLSLPSPSSTKTVFATPTTASSTNNSGSLIDKSGLGGVVAALLGLYLML